MVCSSGAWRRTRARARSSALRSSATRRQRTARLTYALGGADAALFAIDPDTGQIRVGAATTLDYEADKNVYEVTVTATDSSGAKRDRRSDHRRDERELG